MHALQNYSEIDSSIFVQFIHFDNHAHLIKNLHDSFILHAIRTTVFDPLCRNGGSLEITKYHYTE